MSEYAPEEEENPTKIFKANSTHYDDFEAEYYEDFEGEQHFSLP